MPLATNPIDGEQVYVEDDGGIGAPVVVLGGFLDPIDLVRRAPLARALRSSPEEFRLIFVDHRGHGRSGKPLDAAAFAMETRVADVATAVDEWGSTGRFRWCASTSHRSESSPRARPS